MAVKRSQVGIEISCTRLSIQTQAIGQLWLDQKKSGYITSAVYSPRLDKNIALAMMDVNHSALDTSCRDDNSRR